MNQEGQRRQEKTFEENLDGNMKSTLGCLGMNLFFFIVTGIPLDRLNLLILLWDGAQTWLASSGTKQKSLQKVEKAFMMMIGFFILLLISTLRDVQESRWRRQSSNWLFYFHLFRICTFAGGYFYPLIKTRNTLRENRQERNENEDDYFERNENGEETSGHLKKLDSSAYIVYKYWMLVSGLWTLKSYESNNEDDDDLPENKDFTFYLMCLAGFGIMILNIWHIVNCGLVFEGMRRKNLQLIQYSLKSMDLYSIVYIVIHFFGFGNEASQNRLKERSIGHNFFDMSSTNWTLMVIVILLVWRVYCHFVYIYGAQKVRDALIAHDRLRRSRI